MFYLFLKTFRLLSGIFRCNTVMFSAVNWYIFRCYFAVRVLCSYGFEEINVGIFINVSLARLFTIRGILIFKTSLFEVVFYDCVFMLVTWPLQAETLGVPGLGVLQNGIRALFIENELQAQL